MKQIIIHILRWISVPFAFLLTFFLAYYLGAILARVLLLDGLLIYFIEKESVQSAVSAFIILIGHIVSACASMYVAGFVAPSHKTGTARTAGIINAALYAILYMYYLARCIPLEMDSIAGWVGVTLGTILGFFMFEDVYE